MKSFIKNPYLQTICLFTFFAAVMVWADPSIAGKLDDAFKPVTTAKNDFMSVLTNIVGPAVVVLGVASGGVLMAFKREWIKYSGFAILSGVIICMAEKVGEWVQGFATSA